MWSVWQNARLLFCRKTRIMPKRIVVVSCFVMLSVLVIVFRLLLVSGESPDDMSSFDANSTPQPDEECEPDMVHIALTDDVSQVSVVWASVTDCDWDVFYGRLHRELSRKSVPTSAKLEIDNNYGTGFWYRALLTELVPDTKYNYLIGWRKKIVKSKLFSFHTMQAANLLHTRLMLYGDLSLASRIMDGVIKEGANGYDAVFHVGDIGSALHGDDGLVGDTFLSLMEPLAARVPYMVVPGDLEMSARFVHFRTRFSVPGVHWPMPFDRTWYSVDLGMLHMVAINTEVYGSGHDDVAAAQLAWLERDLHNANNNRSHVPWIIVLGHRPFYTSIRQEPLTRDFAAMETLFYRYHVDLVVQSHAHMYERTWPVYRGKSDGAYSKRKAPVYVTVGTPGYTYGRERLTRRPPRWSAAVYTDGKAESFGCLTVLGPKKLLWQQVSPSLANVRVDEFTLE